MSFLERRNLVGKFVSINIAQIQNSPDIQEGRIVYTKVEFSNDYKKNVKGFVVIVEGKKALLFKVEYKHETKMLLAQYYSGKEHTDRWICDYEHDYHKYLNIYDKFSKLEGNYDPLYF